MGLAVTEIKKQEFYQAKKSKRDEDWEQYRKPEVRCTSVTSVSLFVGVENTWPISHFCNRVDKQPTWLLTLRPLKASE